MKIFSGKQDLYLDIAERYEQYIKLGVLKDGDRLPSVRTAAGELKVNPNTVQRAYSHLESMGLICSLPKKGVFVTFAGDAEDLIDPKLEQARKSLTELRKLGITKEEIQALIEEVFL